MSECLSFAKLKWAFSLTPSHELNPSLCWSLVFHYRQLSTGLTAEQNRMELSKQLDFTMPCCYCCFRYCSCNCSGSAGFNQFLGNSNYLPEYFAQNLHSCYFFSSDAEELSQPTSLYKVLNCSICFSTFLCCLFASPLPVFKMQL